VTAFHKILVANRGEIACRVIRSARAAGYPTVAIFSEADASAPHVRLADQSVCIGPPAAAQSYLDIKKVIGAAARTGADAIHPGYGFLSENAAFAEACAAASITFIGPGAEAIAVMGDKSRAKAAMEDAGVPCVPGFRWQDGDSEVTDEVLKALAEVGYPVLVKASAGGGGRGMRRVDSPEDLPAALSSARAEAEAAFGSGTLLVEKLILGGRHVEVQVMADSYGTVLHLGERDCSVQRRHQKVIEESPCPAVDEELRARLGSTAVEAAAAVGYLGAGTVEFLLAADGSFFFLEMNTRLQVEHPVTEMVTGLDLVDMQLRVAAGEPLGITQDEVALVGHAIEARLYAEDPDQGFMPQTGTVLRWSPPSGEGIRCDDGIREGQEISSWYDPMLAKIIAWGPDRAAASRRLRSALRETRLLGVQHNGAFLDRVLAHPTFAAGEATTTFLEGEFAAADSADEPAASYWALAAMLFVHDPQKGGELAGWRSSGTAGLSHLELSCGDQQQAVGIATEAGRSYRATVGETAFSLQQHGSDGADLRVSIDGVCGSATAAWAADGDTVFLAMDGRSYAFSRRLPGADAAAATGDGSVRSPLAGRVAAVHTEIGASVTAGQPLLVLEAMKLETVVASPCAGTVTAISVAVDDQVARRQVIVQVEPEEAPA
jgi:geranyl-CoA carboxylase alpha subunit